MHSSTIARLLECPWRRAVAGAAAILITATAIGWRWLSPLNLAGENNPATWWSGALFVLAGLVFWQRGAGESTKPRVAWRIVALAAFALGASEIGSLHERLRWHQPERLALAFAGLGVVAWALHTVGRNARDKTFVLHAALGFACLALAAVQEVIEHRIHLQGWANALRNALEEGTELAASFFFVSSAARAGAQRHASTLRDLLERMPSRAALRELALPAFVLSTAVAALWVAGLPDLFNRGNPAAFFPLALYLALACVELRDLVEERKAPLAAIALCGCLLYASIDSEVLFGFTLFEFFPAPDERHSVESVRRWFAGSSAVHMLLIGLAAWRVGPRSLLLVFSAALALSAVTLDRAWLQLVVPGIATLSVFFTLTGAGRTSARTVQTRPASSGGEI